MDVLAASAVRQKEIARAIAGELKEQDEVQPTTWLSHTCCNLD